MAFGLGVAIAELFARIAAALRGGTVGGIGPIPPSPPSPPSPPVTPPGGGITPIPEPPYVPPPMPPPLPPPVIIVPPVNLFPVDPPDPNACAILSLADRIALAALAQPAPIVDASPTVPTIITPSEITTMPSSVGVGQIVEQTDYFRLRAFGSAGAVPVTFFGRIAHPNGVIVPFAHELITDAAGTIYTSYPVPGKGVLLGMAASVPVDSITTGAVNAIAEIGRLVGTTFTPHTLIFSGQLDDSTPLAQGTVATSNSVADSTYFFVTHAGPETNEYVFSFTTAPGRKARILHVSFDFANDASNAPRYPRAIVTVNSQFVYNTVCAVGAIGNQEGRFGATMGGSDTTEFTTNTTNSHQYNVRLPETLWVKGSIEIATGFDAQSAGDTKTDYNLSWEEV